MKSTNTQNELESQEAIDKQLADELNKRRVITLEQLVAITTPDYEYLCECYEWHDKEEIVALMEQLRLEFVGEVAQKKMTTRHLNDADMLEFVSDCWLEFWQQAL